MKFYLYCPKELIRITLDCEVLPVLSGGINEDHTLTCETLPVLTGGINEDHISV